MSDAQWESLAIPVNMAFLHTSAPAGTIRAFYPSPAGATESELHFSDWSRLVALNPLLAQLEPDIEGLIVNRLSEPPGYAIAPIDRCYALTGAVKASWEGISGGSDVHDAVSAFFADLRAQAVAA